MDSPDHVTPQISVQYIDDLSAQLQQRGEMHIMYNALLKFGMR